jgi:predicted AAA+ superfamily ATPase
LSFQEGQVRELIRQKIIDSISSPIPAFTRRDVRLPAERGKAVAVIGMRRTGKTTLLWQVLADRLAAGAARESLLYFSFEDERIAEMTMADLSHIVEEYYRLYPEMRDRNRALFLLDEIQNVPGWEGFARRILDSEKADLFISGSSARLLSREVATAIHGRTMEALVYPFSFREMLRHLGREPLQHPDRLPKAVRSRLESDFLDYLGSGGFPEAIDVPSQDRFALLRGYVDAVLLRDVIERHAVSHPVALRRLVRHLLGNAAGFFSVNKFYGDLRSQGMAIAKDSLHAFLTHLEDAFVVRTVPLATDSDRRRMVNPRKIYPIDPGFIPVFDRSGELNIGHALETCVLIELDRRGAEVSYIRSASGTEVDFLAHYPGGRQELIQVCSSLEDQATAERKARGLEDAAAGHPKADLVLITLTSGKAHSIPANIRLVPVVSWLLSDGRAAGNP